ncbi:hypothetical protein HN011_002717 [Eciton burchellii]|nr:hypothetical protein HN011_002717 [Eciton burchellii]
MKRKATSSTNVLSVCAYTLAKLPYGASSTRPSLTFNTLHSVQLIVGGTSWNGVSNNLDRKDDFIARGLQICRKAHAILKIPSSANEESKLDFGTLLSKFDYADLQARFREFLRSRTRECTANDLVKRRDDATASMAGERGIMGKQSVTWGDYLMLASSWNRSSIAASYAGYRAGSSRNLAKLWNNRARSRAVRRKSRWSSRGRNSLEK